MYKYILHSGILEYSPLKGPISAVKAVESVSDKNIMYPTPKIIEKKNNINNSCKKNLDQRKSVLLPKNKSKTDIVSKLYLKYNDLIFQSKNLYPSISLYLC